MESHVEHAPNVQGKGSHVRRQHWCMLRGGIHTMTGPFTSKRPETIVTRLYLLGSRIRHYQLRCGTRESDFGACQPRDSGVCTQLALDYAPTLNSCAAPTHGSMYSNHVPFTRHTIGEVDCRRGSAVELAELQRFSKIRRVDGSQPKQDCNADDVRTD